MSDWDGLDGPKVELNLSQMDALVKKMQDDWVRVEAAKAAAAVVRAEYDKTERDVLEALEKSGKTKYLVDGVGTVYISNRFTYKVPKDNESKLKLFDWITETKGEDVLTGMISINHQTLNSFTKVEIENNPALTIPGLGIPAHEKSVGFRKAK